MKKLLTMFFSKRYTQINRVGILIVLLFSFSLFSSFSSKMAPYGVKVIVIDAGHGGKDPGCHGKKNLEKDVALAVALKFGNYIEEHLKGVKVIYTRKTDVFVELQERAAIANRAKADLFISIHCNSACYRDKKAKKDICKDHVNGAETFIMGIKNEQGNLDIAKRENSAILLEDNYVAKYEGFDPNSDESYIIMSMFADTYVDHSLKFATNIQKEYCQRVGRCDRGVKRASLWVLWRTYMPSVLTEIGYLTNPEEEAFLSSEKGQDYIASGLFRAFRQYKDDLEGVSKAYNDAFEKQEAYKPKVVDGEQKTEETKSNEAVSVNDIKETTDSDEKEVSVSLKEPLQKENAVNKKNEIEEVPVIYKVQIMISAQKIPLTSSQFNEVQSPGEYIENGIYKYTSGEFTEVKEAVAYKNTLRSKGYSDAFVIATKNGKRIPLK